jgi:drug/metabolite transporter (DMT)-like permease
LPQPSFPIQAIDERRRELSGIILYISASLVLTLMFFAPRLAGIVANPIQVSFLRYVGGAAFVLVLHVFSKAAVRRMEATVPKRIPLQAWLLHGMRAVIGVGQLACTLLAASLLPLSIVQAILAAHGAVVILLIIFLDRRRIAVGTLGPTLACIAGAIVAANPFEVSSPGAAEGYAAAAASCVLWALEVYVFRKAAQFGKPLRFLLPINCFGALLLCGPAVYVWHPFTGWEVMVPLLMGPMAAFSQFLSLEALQRARLEIVVPFRYLNVPFASLLGLFLAQIPTVTTIVGAGVVVVSGVIVSRGLTKEAT